MITGRFVEPLGLITGPVAFHALREGFALPLQGGDIAFTFVRLIEDGEDLGVGPIKEVPEDWHEAMHAIAQRPAPFAGLPTDRPLVMGIINVTPDSFSDGGLHAETDAAIAAGHAMLEAGADILDIGGESTRPGAAAVTVEEEIARILPVVRELAKAAPVSIDTRNAATMRAALEAGAEVINDISALRHDAEALRLVASSEVPVVLMHMPGDDPTTMQSLAEYDDVAVQVAGFLRDRIAMLEARGIPRGRIALDPGIGFGKTLDHNLALIDRLPLIAALGCRVVLGASRKRFIGTLSGVEEAGQRVPGSVAAAIAGAARGASVLRVHDVAETVQALSVWRACGMGREPGRPPAA
ncbi:dihydropteroate synthase [Roseomonas terrae]|jgi:dihydropteroate synthase|uniref:dihydropteroate synthase n=1 Tax=Neoroseomonas terrae TaxID=424799 RepID=A0ABS5EG96_9PROT|nr:dihydropteroate synthase [Neoroseomonas terrae]MBR0650039.1 dihydropteroate synthase [Neoroseomonas terrae]